MCSWGGVGKEEVVSPDILQHDTWDSQTDIGCSG